MPGQRAHPIHATALLAADHESPTSAPRHECDACGATFDGTPAGAGLFVWTRGEEVRYEEPPLCEECASSIAVGAMAAWGDEDEE